MYYCDQICLEYSRKKKIGALTQQATVSPAEITKLRTSISRLIDKYKRTV